MTAPTAIYQPRDRALLLASGGQTMAVPADRAAPLARALARLGTNLRGSAALRLTGPGGHLSLAAGDVLPLACAIDHALAVPAIVDQMMKDAPACR